jgi:hypothetical protein
MRMWSFLFCMMYFFGFPSDVYTSDFYVTAVIRDFPMKSGDPIYKDFYVNAGTNNGLRKGVFLNALRKMAVFDNINSKMAGETEIKIARLKIIHADKTFSIARMVRLFDKEETPNTGYDSIMIGDFIEVSEKQ